MQFCAKFHHIVTDFSMGAEGRGLELKKEIREALYILYQRNKITKKLYNISIKSL